MASLIIISATFRSQRFHYFLALCRKYVLAVNAHLVHSNRVENQVAILLYEFRETVPVNVALGQFFF